MEHKEFVIQVRSKREFFDHLQADLQRIDAGEKEEERNEIIGFESINAANKLLTAKRVQLLCFLHNHGPMNTHELALRLGRDYKNVRQDVIALQEVGIVVKQGRSLTAPWDKISVQIDFASSKNFK